MKEESNVWPGPSLLVNRRVPRLNLDLDSKGRSLEHCPVVVDSVVADGPGTARGFTLNVLA